jgi:hypothetical protein
VSALTARIVEDFASTASTLPAAGEAAARRRAALAALEIVGLPSSRDENWK